MNHNEVNKALEVIRKELTDDYTKITESDRYYTLEEKKEMFRGMQTLRYKIRNFEESITSMLINSSTLVEKNCKE